MQAKGADSHMDSADWHMVDLDAGDSPRAYSPALVEVPPMAGAEQAEPFLAEAVAAAAEQRQQQQALVASEAAVASSTNDDARSDGTASPTSERRADAVLSQPVTCTAAVGVSLSASDVQLAAAQEELLSAGGPGSPSRQHQQHQQQGDEVEHVRSLSRISQEGSLDGFASDDAEPLLPAVGATADLDDDRSRGGWAAVLWSSVRQEFAAEWGDLSSLLSLSSDALQAKLAQVNAAMQAVGASCNQTIHQVVKQLHANCPSGWALLSLGGLTVLAVVAVAAQLVTNRRLAMELKKRDRELARLVVKILQLQDALHNSARPILRHTAYTAHLM